MESNYLLDGALVGLGSSVTGVGGPVQIPQVFLHTDLILSPKAPFFVQDELKNRHVSGLSVSSHFSATGSLVVAGLVVAGSSVLGSVVVAGTVVAGSVVASSVVAGSVVNVTVVTDLVVAGLVVGTLVVDIRSKSSKDIVKIIIMNFHGLSVSSHFLATGSHRRD